MHILLVDDSSTMRRIQKNILVSLGFNSILEAVDGRDAVNKTLENSDIDLILMDWNMPNMSGIEALKQIKETATTREIPVIMVTSESSKDRILEAMQNGASSYVVKPFDPKTLKEKVAKVMEVHNITCV